MRARAATSTAAHRRTQLAAAGRPRQTVLAVTLFALIQMAIAGPYLLIPASTSYTAGDSNPMRQVIYLSIYGLVLYAVRFNERPRRMLALPLSLTLLVGYCFVTITWAIDPDTAVRRLILTTLIMLTIFTLVENMGFAQALAVIRVSLIFALVINYAMVIAVPSVGVHQAAELLDPELVGNWRGILVQKNFTGALCAITVLVFLFDAGRLSALLRGAVLLATLFFLYKTQSKTSIGLLVVSAGAGLAYRAYNPRYRALVIPTLALLVGLAVALIALFWAEVTAPLADPRALTGRSQIWPVLIAFWQDHWLQGSGYGSFWNIGVASPVFQYTGDKNWIREISSGHNGYIDFLAQTGLPGILLAVACVIVWPMGKLLASTTLDRRSGSLILSVLMFCWLHNGTESSLLDRDQIVQIFLMLGIAMVEVAGRRSPPERSRPAVAEAPMHAAHAPA